MKTIQYDLVTVIPEIEDRNIVVPVLLSDAEIEFLMEEARAMPGGWDGVCRRKPLQEQQS